jgi:hypothetical protein
MVRNTVTAVQYFFITICRYVIQPWAVLRLPITENLCMIRHLPELIGDKFRATMSYVSDSVANAKY